MTNSPPAALPDFYHLNAPPAWQQIDFISDLHLFESEPANFEAWQRYMAGTTADAVFILGDLFEVWVGDDVLQGPSFETRCASVLAQAARHRPVYFMHGNRDFLLGNAALEVCGMQGLHDPTVLDFAGVRTLLSHGDELCLADTDYQVFRQHVRSSAWQTAFLARPLAQRQHIARELRTQSEARKQLGGPWIDLDPAATAQWVHAAGAQQMVHGHTHEGVDHFLHARVDLLTNTATDRSASRTGIRHVLCDWHADATPPRAQVLRMQRLAGSASGSLDVRRLPVNDVC